MYVCCIFMYITAMRPTFMSCCVELYKYKWKDI